MGIELLLYANDKSLWDPSIFEIVKLVNAKPSVRLLADKYIKAYCSLPRGSDYLEHDLEFFDLYSYGKSAEETEYDVVSIFHSLLEHKDEFDAIDAVTIYGWQSLQAGLAISRHFDVESRLYLNSLPFDIERLDFNTFRSLKRIIKYACQKVDCVFTSSPDIRAYLVNALNVDEEKVKSYSPVYDLGVIEPEMPAIRPEALFVSAAWVEGLGDERFFRLVDEIATKIIYFKDWLLAMPMFIKNASRYDGSINALEGYMHHQFYRELVMYSKIHFCDDLYGKYIGEQFRSFLSYRGVAHEVVSSRETA